MKFTLSLAAFIGAALSYKPCDKGTPLCCYGNDQYPGPHCYALGACSLPSEPSYIQHTANMFVTLSQRTKTLPAMMTLLPNARHMAQWIRAVATFSPAALYSFSARLRTTLNLQAVAGNND
ncbi:hypothetical protein VHEMI06136 [[Torrubiella] hemipterigena]|uniref:Uncharacterized protein n=1 Tax=[Torrubiella] hemipterigena TaxID=1531966 RepID=A0A0A1TIC2_9HYPO|nr:hypothetical protein VHEMI06136 [[Torrubiella] hemipterigena]